jgi:hypothetical protein
MGVDLEAQLMLAFSRAVYAAGGLAALARIR